MDKEKIILLIVAIILAICNGLANGYVQHPITDVSDTSNLAPMQLHIANPSLYSRDPAFHEVIASYPEIGNWILAQAIKLSANIRIAYFIVSLILVSIFTYGMHELIKCFTKNKTAIWIFTLASAIPHIAPEAMFGIRIGMPITRDFTMIFVPYILRYFFQNMKKPKKLIALFFVTGLIANIHILSIGILFYIMISIYSIKNLNLKKLPIISFMIIAFLIGSSPFVIKYATETSITINNSNYGQDLIDEYIQIRGPVGELSIYYIAYIFLHFVPLAIIAFVSWIRKKNQIMTQFAILSIGCLFMSLAINAFFPALKIFNFFRGLKYFWLPILYYVSIYSAKMLNSKTSNKKAIGIAAIILIMIPSGSIFGNALYSYGKEIYDSSRGLDDELDIERQINIETSDDWVSFYDVCDWAKENTDMDTLFLIPPKGLSHFRAYSQRSIVQCFKMMGGVEGYIRYKEISNTYMTNSTEEFVKIANKYQADYILIYKEKNKIDLPVIFENSGYIIYIVI